MPDSGYPCIGKFCEPAGRVRIAGDLCPGCKNIYDLYREKERGRSLWVIVWGGVIFTAWAVFLKMFFR